MKNKVKNSFTPMDPNMIEVGDFFIFDIIAARYDGDANELVLFFRFIASNSEVPFYKIETFEVGSKRYSDMLASLCYAGILNCDSNDCEMLPKVLEKLGGFCRLVSAGASVSVDVTSFMSTKDFIDNMSIRRYL